MKATITDVAKAAGVSMKTVSRVLNNEPNVAAKTREKVLAVAGELKYSPNLAAKGLASSKSYLVALVYDNSPSPFYMAKLQSGAIEACRKYGFHLVPEPLEIPKPDSEESQAETIRLLLHRLNVDGVILTPPLSDSPGIIIALKSMNIPFVLVAPRNRNMGSNIVKMDDVQAARKMTEFLINQGHTSIGFIEGHPKHSAAPLRYEGFRDAMAYARLKVHSNNVQQGDFSFRSGVAAAEELLKELENRPTAIFASNDDMAAAVVSVASRLDIAVPNELSVCGFDDSPIATILYPQLTTIQQPIFDMGFQAVKILVDPAQKTLPAAVYTLDFKLIVRDSACIQGD